MRPVRERGRCRSGYIAVLLAALLRPGPAAAAEGDVFSRVELNGEQSRLDPPGLVEDGEPFLPASFVSAQLGIAVVPSDTPGLWIVGAFGTTLKLRPNVPAYLTGDTLRECTHPPRLQGNELQVPLSLLVVHFGLEAADLKEGLLRLRAPGGEVQDVYEEPHEAAVRVVLQFSTETRFAWKIEPNSVVVEVPGGDRPLTASRRGLQFSAMATAEVTQDPGPPPHTRVAIIHRSPGRPRLFTDQQPPRLVVDIPLMAAAESPTGQLEPPPPLPQPLPVEEELPPVGTWPPPPLGQLWQVRRFETARGVAVGYVVEVDPRQRGVAIKPALAGATIHERAPLSRIVAQNGATAGINGGFFASGGAPLGMLVIDGEWIKHPIRNRAALGIMEDRTVRMANLRFAGSVTLPLVGRLTLDALNQSHTDADRLILYSGRWGNVVKAKPDTARVQISAEGKVLAVNSEGAAMPIPRGGYVLSGLGKRVAQLAQVKVNAQAVIDLRATPHWANMVHALGGGPMLVDGGVAYVDLSREGFGAGQLGTANPRTAVGVRRDGTVILMAVDGRSPGYSAGLTLWELAKVMADMGARQALNVDGGGSTTLVVGPQCVNRPCEGAQRRISNALLVFLPTR